MRHKQAQAITMDLVKILLLFSLASLSGIENINIISILKGTNNLINKPPEIIEFIHEEVKPTEYELQEREKQRKTSSNRNKPESEP